jgi:uncharacterized protein DUF6644
VHYLLPLFQWSDATWVANAIRDSRWAFPIIESIHLLALTVLLGAVVVLSLRLFGLALRYQTIPEVAQSFAVPTWISIAVMLVTGFLLFSSEALKCYGSPSFQVKMAFLIPALLFQATLFRSATKSKKIEGTPYGSRALAVALLALWFGVGLAGRAIGFIG